MYTTINRKDNKLLYFLDNGIDKLATLFVNILKLFVPAKFKDKFDKLANEKDMLHNVLGLALFNAVGSFCVMVTQLKLANYFGASIYGIYSYCLAMGEVGAMFVRYGRNKTMVRDLVQYPEKRDELVVSTFFVSLINLVLFLVVSFSFHNQLGIEVNWTYLLLILTPCLTSLTLDPLYESMKMMGWSAIYTFLQKFIFLVIIWLLFLFCFEVNLFVVGVLTAASWFLVYTKEYLEVITQLKINFIQKIKVTDLWNLYKDNFVIFLSCVTGVAFGPVINLILNSYTDSKSVGIYAAGLQIYNICLFLNSQISRVGNPMMAQAGKSDCPMSQKKNLVKKYSLIMLMTSIPFALPMLLCPDFIVGLLFSEEYSELGNYLPFLAIYLIFITLGVVYTQYLISTRKDKTYFTIYVATAIGTLITALCLIPSLGLLGAFIALCIPHSIGCVFYGLFTYKDLNKMNK